MFEIILEELSDELFFSDWQFYYIQRIIYFKASKIKLRKLLGIQKGRPLKSTTSIYALLLDKQEV